MHELVESFIEDVGDALEHAQARVTQLRGELEGAESELSELREVKRAIERLQITDAPEVKHA